MLAAVPTQGYGEAFARASRTAICCLRQDVNQPAGSPLGSRPDPATAAIPDQRRNSALTCENTRSGESPDNVTSCTISKRSRSAQIASELRKREVFTLALTWPKGS